ncbi:MAG: hypothetical protein ACI9QN_002590, partial [Arcticibacterium sp.]
AKGPSQRDGLLHVRILKFASLNKFIKESLV